MIDENIQDISSCVVISSSPIYDLYGEKLLDQLSKYKTSKIIVPDGEAAKSWAVAEQLLGQYIDHDLDRKSLIVALGGGSVGDLAGFTVGARVAYVTGAYGVYASERVIDQAQLLRIPAGVTDEVAASALLRGLTVEMLLRRVHQSPPVRGSSCRRQREAGQLLCQWASHIGAKIIGTVADDEQDSAAAAAGCHYRINFKRENFVEQSWLVA